MSDAVKQLKKYEDRKAKDRKKAEKKPLSGEEKKALRTLQKEARVKGAKLTSNGEGGLSPSLVLAVFRRDEYTCKIHGDQGEGPHGGLQLHHKGGIVESKWLSKKGHKNVLNNIVTICRKGHDEIHDKARKEGVDSSQKKPEGDKHED